MKVFITLFLSIISYQSFGQVFHIQYNQGHHNLYWWHRYRFQEAFTIIDDIPGGSIPIVERNAGATSATSPNDRAQYASETMVHLGWYLGVLATEYRLLKNNNELDALEKVKTELYYALSAIRRLDYYANCNWNGHAGPSGNGCDATEIANPVHGPCLLNGFMVRHDVPDDFFTGQPEIHAEINSHNDFFGLYEINDKQYQGGAYYPVSNDAIIHLTMGLYLIWKLCDNETFGVDKDGNDISGALYLNFKNQAKFHIGLTLRYISLNGWTLVRPDGDDVPEGCNAYTWAKPYEVILDELGEGAGQTASIGQRAAWQSLKDPLNPVTSPDIAGVNASITMHMALTLAAISDSWVNIFGTNVTSRSIGVQSEKFDWSDFYVLLHKVLHPSSYDHFNNTSTLNALDYSFSNLPCSIHFYGGSSGVTPWRSSHRFVNGPDSQSGHWVHGNYNGLDFMLLTNLYYLTSGTALPYYENQIDRSVGGTLSGGTPSNPRFLYGFRSIDVNSEMLTGSFNEVKGGECVTLSPGCEIQYGAEALVHIDDFECMTSIFGTPFYKSETDQSDNGFQMSDHTITYGQETGTYSETSQSIHNKHITIHPNPNKGSFTVLLDNLELETQLSVLSPMGIVIHSTTPTENRTQIDLNNPSSGIYLVRIQNKHTSRIVRVLVE